MNLIDVIIVRYYQRNLPSLIVILGHNFWQRFFIFFFFFFLFFFFSLPNTQYTGHCTTDGIGTRHLPGMPTPKRCLNSVQLCRRKTNQRCGGT